MAVARGSQALIRIEAYDVVHAGALVRALVRDRSAGGTP